VKQRERERERERELLTYVMRSRNNFLSKHIEFELALSFAVRAFTLKEEKSDWKRTFDLCNEEVKK
jgi:hypothetical protein